MNFEVGDIAIYNPNYPTTELLPPLERTNDHCKILHVGEYYLTVNFITNIETNDIDRSYDIVATSIYYLPNNVKYYKNLFTNTVLTVYMKTVLFKYINKCWEYKTNTIAEIGPCNIILQYCNLATF